MKKYLIILSFLLPLIAFAQFSGISGVSDFSPWRLSGTAIQPKISSWTLGSSGTPIGSGFFTNLTTALITISNSVMGNLTVNGGTINLGASPNTATTTIVANGSGQLTLSAAGTNQNVVLTPSGTGFTLLNGNVGIGTTSPASLFSVSGAGYFTGNMGIGVANPSGPLGTLQVNTSISTQANSSGGNSSLSSYDEGTINYLSMLKRGSTNAANLGLGNGGVELLAGGAINLGIETQGISNYIAFGTGGVAAGNERMRITSGGNLGIGTTNPTQMLMVAAGVNLAGIANGAGTAYLCTTLATGVISTSTSACNGSSLRYKDNVQDISYGLTDILKMRPVSFDYKPELLVHGHQVGFIAEEMFHVVPEVVGFDSQGRPDNIDYARLTSVLTKAIQQQQIEIDELKKEIKNHGAPN